MKIEQTDNRNISSMHTQLPCSPSWWSKANNNWSLHLNCCSYLKNKGILTVFKFCNISKGHNIGRINQKINVQKKNKNKNEKREGTAEEAIDSKWVIGSPTYLTVFLKYKSWLKTFSAYTDQRQKIIKTLKQLLTITTVGNYQLSMCLKTSLTRIIKIHMKDPIEKFEDKYLWRDRTGPINKE